MPLFYCIWGRHTKYCGPFSLLRRGGKRILFSRNGNWNDLIGITVWHSAEIKLLIVCCSIDCAVSQLTAKNGLYLHGLMKMQFGNHDIITHYHTINALKYEISVCWAKIVLTKNPQASIAIKKQGLMYFAYKPNGNRHKVEKKKENFMENSRKQKVLSSGNALWLLNSNGKNLNKKLRS